jgi:HlyD family secretion protein
VFIPEPIRVSVGAGTAAMVYLDGSDRQWAAVVRYVSTDAAFTPYYALNEKDRSRLSFLAEVVLTDAEAASLPTGMPVQVELVVAGDAR